MSEERFENENEFNGSLTGPETFPGMEYVPGADFHADADPDPVPGADFHADADPDPVPGAGFHADADPGSGTGTHADAFSGTDSYSNPNPGFGAASNPDSAASPGGRYYSYGSAENSSGRTGAYTGRASAGARGNDSRKDREKPGKWVALALAVILVFILGAGAGAYMSGRNATAALSEGSQAEEKRSGAAAGAETGKEEETSDSENKTEKKQTAGSSSSQGSIARVEDQNQSLQDTTVADVAEKVMPAIVSVYNKFTEQGQFFGRTYTQEGESAGSGIIIEETDGELLIVTNNHVVEGADSLSVQFINEENCEAALKGTDASSDLAVIAVSLDDLSAETRDAIAIAELGDSDSLRIGEHAIAIGNALGYGQSLTVGYISALNREITSEDGITGTFIQTDAAINPGNSGGALLNSAGQVIGINSNKIGGNAVEGMGFAIPITKALPIIDGLKAQESRTKVAEDEQGVLGIRGITVSSSVASAYGLQVGAYVESIVEGSGAADSDLQEGDIITAINGQTVTGMEDLSKQLVYYAAGTEVTLMVQHPLEGSEYQEKEVSVTLSPKDILEGEDDGSGSEYDQRDQMQEEEEGGYGDFFSFPFGSFGF